LATTKKQAEPDSWSAQIVRGRSRLLSPNTHNKGETMSKKHDVQPLKRAVELSLEFADADPIKVQTELAYAEKKAKEREMRNQFFLNLAEAEWKAACTIEVRIGELSEDLRKAVESSEKLNLVAAALYAEKLVARMERRIARLEAEVELNRLREEESAKRKSWTFVNGVVIPKPSEVAHLIAEPILNMR
jgi:hypothetical protein